MASKNKYRYLLKNMGLLTLSNFGTKLLSFFLVPLYTSILTTAEYGSFDFVNTTISLLVPIFTLDIVDAVVRFSLDEKQDKVQVFTIGLKYILRSFLFVTVFLILNRFLNFMPVVNEYIGCFVFYYAAYVFNQFMIFFARGMDDVFDLAISSIINAVVMLGLNIIFLLIFKIGIIGYFMAYITAQFVAGLYNAIRLKVWKYVNFHSNDRNLQGEMAGYSKPLILNMISWWINNASDRYVVSWICGLSANGLLAVGNKIPSILNIFQVIFTQAWQLSTVKAYDPEDKEDFFSNIYTSYSFLMVEICAVLMFLDKFLARILYAKDFFVAWQYVPFYLIAIVFGAMSSFCSGIFRAVKDSKTESLTTIIGAICNIIINLVLVLTVGAIGAAIATAIAYIIVWVCRIVVIRKYIKLKINLKRDIIAYLFLFIQAALLLNVEEFVTLYSVMLMIIFIITALYYSVVIKLLKTGFSNFRKNK